jgi:hypothetical protein
MIRDETTGVVLLCNGTSCIRTLSAKTRAQVLSLAAHREWSTEGPRHFCPACRWSHSS